MTTFTTEDRLNAETLRDTAANLFKNDKLTKKQQKKMSSQQYPLHNLYWYSNWKVLPKA